MANGVMRAVTDAEVVQVPLADGGDGTMRLVVGARSGEVVTLTVKDPLFRDVETQYGLVQGVNGVFGLPNDSVSSPAPYSISLQVHPQHQQHQQQYQTTAPKETNRSLNSTNDPRKTMTMRNSTRRQDTQ